MCFQLVVLSALEENTPCIYAITALLSNSHIMCRACLPELGAYKAPAVRVPPMDTLLQLNDKWGLQLNENEVRPFQTTHQSPLVIFTIKLFPYFF